MIMTVMDFNRIRDLVLDLGIKDDNNEGYIPRKGCLRKYSLFRTNFCFFHGIYR